MTDRELFTLSINEPFSSRDSIYEWLAMSNASANLSPLEIKKSFLHRESQGDILISKGVVLPHFESPLLKRSNISLIRPKNPVSKWSGIDEEINLVIALSFKPDESKERQEYITQFIRKLAEESFIEELMKVNSEERVHFLLSK